MPSEYDWREALVSSPVASYCIEDLEIGMSASYRRTVTDGDIREFADVSGDTNPVHLDDEYAAGTRFKSRIAHGMLSAAFISTVVGTRLPGQGSIYLGQELKFTGPVRIGDTVETTATITDLNREKGRVRLKTVCEVDGKPVIKGEALMLVPARDD